MAAYALDFVSADLRDPCRHPGFVLRNLRQLQVLYIPVIYKLLIFKRTMNGPRLSVIVM